MSVMAILHQLTSQGLVIQAHEPVHVSCPTKGAGKMRYTTLAEGMASLSSQVYCEPESHSN